MGGIALAGLVAVATGCSFSSDPSGTGFLCEQPPKTCPVGFHCVDGTCVEGAADSADATPAAIDALMSDASTSGPDAMIDICQEATQAPNSDGCSVASVNVTEAAHNGGVTMYGDTTTYINDLGSPTSDTEHCLGYITAGADAFYRVDATVGETITAHVYGATWDTALYLTAGCTTGVACYTAADNLTASGEQISYVVETTGTFYVVVDTAGTAKGCYAIDIRVD